MILKPKFLNKDTKNIAFILFFSLFLMGCQSNNLFNEEVESIEVYESESKLLVTTITDSSVIDPLVEELERAQTSSTAAMDLILPEYNLFFLNEEKSILQEFGYYVEEKNYGVIGRYWQNDTDTHYGVTTELDINEE